MTIPIARIETRAGFAWVTCTSEADKQSHEQWSRDAAIAELTRLGRRPQQDDQRTTSELWDDAKGRVSMLVNRPARVR